MGILRGYERLLGNASSAALRAAALGGRAGVRTFCFSVLLSMVVMSASAQTIGTQYKVTRVGRDVLGGQGYFQSQNIMAISPDGRYATGVRFGSTTRAFLMTTAMPAVTDLPKVVSSHPYGHGKDVNNEGDVVGYEKWTTGNVVNIIPWFYDRSAGTVTSLYDALNPTLTAIPTAITTGSTYAFGTVDVDGPLGATPSQGVYWNLSTRVRTPIPGVRDVLDASADGSVLLVVGTDGKGKILRGSFSAGWSATVASLGYIHLGKVSPDGRYVGTTEIENDCLMGPFVFDTVAGIRTNLPMQPGDTLGATVGAVSDTGRVLGSVHTASGTGSFSVMWGTPASVYTTFVNLLASDGHTSQDATYYAWNLYNGGDGISADGQTMSIYGRNISAVEDSMLFQQNCPTITLNPATLPAAPLNSSYSQAVTASGGAGPYVYTLGSGALPTGLALNSLTGVISGTRTSLDATSFSVRAMDANGCTGTRAYTMAQVCGNLVISPAAPPNATINVNYSQTFTTTGGSGPYTWAITSGSLPSGITLNTATGVISGRATAANAGAAFTLQVTDSIGCQISVQMRLVVCPVISLTPTSFSNGTLGLGYNATVTANSGTPPYTYAVSSGSLPAGLSLDAANGTVTGLPTATGNSSLILRATDANGCSGTRAYTLRIRAATSDFGDYSRFGSASSTVNNALRIGSLVDAEGGAITNDTATGDDEFGVDDEDGVTFSSLVQGQPGSATIRLTNTRGSSARLNMWMDWDGDGNLTNSERVANNVAVSNGTNNANRVVNFTVPANAVEGPIGARVRLTTTSNPGPTGASGQGEVEDYVVTVNSLCPSFAVIVLNYTNNTMSRFNGENGSHLATWTPSGLSSPNYGYRLSDNTMLVANGSANTITRHNPFTGALINTLIPAGQGLNFPYQMAVAQDSSIYIANQNAGNVLRFNQTTGAILGTVLSTSNPAGLVIDDEGFLYVTQNISGGTLRKYNSSGTLISTLATWPAGEYPRGMAWGPDDRLYINVRNNNANNGRVDAITLPANTRATFVTLDSGSQPYSGVKWGPDGNLYVVDYAENEVDVFSPEGSLLRKITTSLNGPHAVAFADCNPSTQDFGDYAGFASANSTWSTTIRLGNEADTESSSRANMNANGDDIDDIDDEDGVTMPETLVAGSTVTIPVKLLNTSGSMAYVSAWLDANQNGDLTDPGEKVINNQPVPNNTLGTTQNFTINVPQEVTSGVVGMRFRVSNVSNVSPTGSGGIGEVEDYIVTLQSAPRDYGDLASFGTASSIVTSSLRIGTNVTDAEDSSLSNSTATGDDASGTDDEDSVMPSFTVGASSSLNLSLFNNSGANAYLTGWIDWNNNGTLESGERIIPETTLTSSSAQSRTFTVNVPVTATVGQPIGVRLRLSSLASVPATGDHGSGEVEDYRVTIQCPAVTLSPAFLPVPVTGTGYSQFFSANGGTAPYTFSVSSGALPAWATLNPSTGALAGTPNTVTSASFVIRATDALGCTGTQSYTLAPVCPVLTINTSSLPVGAAGSAYSQTLSVSGGSGPYVWAVTSGSLPNGLSLSPSGVISGTPSAGNGSGTAVTFRATDASGCQVSLALQLRICPVITLTPSTLAAPSAGSAYNQAVSASGGVAPYLYSISSGSLPTGLNLNGSTGAITGTATSQTPASFIIRATDANGCQGQRAYTLTPACPALTVASGGLPSATVGANYNQALTVSGGTSPYSWSVSAGTLPAGLTLNAGTGAITGKATTANGAGTSVTFQVTDAGGCQGSVTLPFKVCPVLTLSPSSVPAANVGFSYSQALSGSGGTAPYAFAITSGSLPSGLTLNSSGLISGTAASAATTNFIVRITDANGCTGTRAYSLSAGCPPVNIYPATLPSTLAGASYYQRLTGDFSAGLQAQYYIGRNFENLTLTRQEAEVKFAWGGGSPDPSIPADNFSARWTGTVLPPATGSYTFRVKADDGLRLWVNEVLIIDQWKDQGATAYAAAVSLSSGVPAAVRLEYYEKGGDAEVSLEWTGPTFAQKIITEWTAYDWSVVSGSLPQGLTLDSVTGVISGVLTSSDSATFTVRARDWQGCEGTRVYTIEAGCPAISITPTSLPAPSVGVPYSQRLAASPVIGLTGEYYSGLNFNTLLLSRKDASIDFDWGEGSPDPVVPTNAFSVRWTGNLVPPATGTYTFRTNTDDGVRLWVNNVLVIDRWVDQAPTAYTATVSLTAGTAVPVKMEYYENGGGATAQLYWTGPGISTLQPITQWQSYTWSLAAGSLPAGLTLNPVSGLISGTPTTSVGSSFTVRARDATGCSGTRSYTLGVACPTITISPATLPDPYLGVSYNRTLTASGGEAPLSWSLASGSLPAGLSLSSGGVITGTPTAIGPSSFIIRVTDSRGCVVTQSYSLTARSLSLGNLVWVDMNNDGQRQSAESGVAGLRLELWTTGGDGIHDNGGGDDLKAAEDVITDATGKYEFTQLIPGSYYVRIPVPPLHYPSVSTASVALDNGVDNDSNALQPGGRGAQVFSPVIVLSPAGEPPASVDGDGTDANSTVDFGFANLDACYVTNYLDNPSFEFQQLPNSTGTATSVLNYNGTGTSLGSGINAYQWSAGSNATSGLGEPIQRVQILAGNSGGRVSWMESLKSRHGRRHLLLQGSNARVSLRAAGGGNWSSALVAGREYQLSVWAANASSAPASISWDMAANAPVFQVISGPSQGTFSQYTVPQSEMIISGLGEQQCCGLPVTAGSLSSFGPSEYNNWSEAVNNGNQPEWRQLTWRFRIAPGATAAQIDTASLILGSALAGGSLVVDYVSLCQISTVNTLAVGNLVWNDVNNNGLKESSELGRSGVTVQLYRSTDLTAGNADDVLIGSTTTSTSGSYQFSDLSEGRYVVQVLPPSNLPVTGGTPVTLDDGVNNDNNGSQPGGPGTPLISPVISLNAGQEPVNDGDTNDNTDFSVDFGLFSGITIGNQVWADTNNNGVFDSASEAGISGLTVELLNNADEVIATTTTNASGVYSMLVYQPGVYRVRIPDPGSSFPLVSAVADPNDNGEDNDSNALQPGGVGTAAYSPFITLTAGREPGNNGSTNTENTIDFGFRACPSILINPAVLGAATRNLSYTVNLNATGGTSPYVYTLSTGTLPDGLTLSAEGAISGTVAPSAFLGDYDFTVSAADSTGCIGARSYTLRVIQGVIAISPPTLPAGVQYTPYSQALTASGGTAPYSWTVAPAIPPGAVALWAGENSAATVVGVDAGTAFAGTAYAPGRIGQAFVFDGVDDYVAVADSEELRPPLITIEAWVNPSSPQNANGSVIAKTTSSLGTDGYGLGQLGPDTFGFWLNDRANNRVTTTLTTGVWQHVAATYDGSTMRLYVNGVLVSSSPFTGSINHSNTSVLIGGGLADGPWKGGVDELAIYNRALTPSEIQARHATTHLFNDGLPEGLSLNPSTGQLSGTPTSPPGPYSFHVRAGDSTGTMSGKAYNFTLACPVPVISPATLPDATRLASYSQSLSATGGTAPYTWSITTGSLPAGLSLSAGGVISGTSTANPATYNFTVRAEDGYGCSSTRAYTLRIQCSALTLAPDSLPAARQYAPYTTPSFTATGGTGPYVYSISSGSLPAGMALSSGGALSGTPSAVPDVYTVSIRATDSVGCTVSRTYNITVTCPAIAIFPAGLAVASQNVAYAQTLTATNGNGSYVWSVVTGTLPSGLTLSPGGLLSGTVTAAAGSYTFTVQVTDGSNCTATKDYNLPVACPLITVSPSVLATGTPGSPYNQNLAASGGVGPYTWATAGGNLPEGITLSTGGLLSGTPEATSFGSYTFTVRITDARGCIQDTSLTLAVGCPVITMNPSSLPPGSVGVEYDATLSAQGGTGAYVWSVVSGSLPTGLQLVHGDSKLVGSGSAYPSIFDPAGSVTVDPPTANPSSESYGGSAGPTQVGYWSLRATGGVSISHGLLGLMYQESGARTALQGSALRFQISNNTSNLLAQLENDDIIASTWEATATFDESDAVFELEPDTRYAVSFLVDGSHGLLEPDSALSPVFTVELLDGAGNAIASQSAGSIINLRQQLVGGGTSGTVNLIFNTPQSVAPGAVKLRIKGSANLNKAAMQVANTFATVRNLQITASTVGATSASARIIGTPLCGTDATGFTLRATDANGCAAVADYTLPIACAPVNLVTEELEEAVVGENYLQVLEASEGLAPYTWTLAAGTLPPGLSLAPTGGISGVPTVAVESSITVMVTDACGCSTTRQFTLLSTCPLIDVTPEELPLAYVNTAYQQQLTADGGTGPYLWTVESGSLPAGMSLTAGGVITGQASVTATASFTVSVTDANGCSTLWDFNLSVRGLTVGNLVFNDANLNGLRDVGEPGVEGATVQLWRTGADMAIGGSGPNADVQVGSPQTTGDNGAYAFTGLAPGYYYLRVLPPASFPLPGGNPVGLDNGIDNDNNAASQPGGAGTEIYSPVIQLTVGEETVDEDDDPDTDLTVDFGLFRGMGMGNLVFQDSNDNGQRDDGEPGIDGVTLELWSPGADGLIGGSDDVRLRSITTTGGGQYSFLALAPGQYYVCIPLPPQSHPLSSSMTVMLDDRIDDDDNGHQIAGGAIYGPVISLQPGQEISNEGFTDSTVDFGLCNVLPTAYLSATHDDSIQVYDPESREFKGLFHHPFGVGHNQGDGNPFDVPYHIELGPDGHFYVAAFGANNLRQINASGVDQGTVLNNATANVSVIESFAIGPDGNFYVVDLNGQRVVRFHGPLSSTPGQPMGSAPHTFLSQAGIQDLNFGPDGNLYAVIQNGAAREVRRYSATTGTLLNVIVTDAQLVNMVPGGEPVSIISGIDIHGSTLYGVNRLDGEIFRVNLAQPASPGAPELIATISSAGQGAVEARDIEMNPGNGRLYVVGYNWSKPVIGGSFATGALVEVDPATAPNGTVKIFEAPMPTPPGPNNEIWSGPRSMAFGRPFVSLAESVSIGSLVWNDANTNGQYDPGERGIPGVRVELWHDADDNLDNGAEVRLGWTYTDQRGTYYFSGQAPGRYQVKIPAINFSEGLPLAGSGFSTPITSNLDDQIDNDDNGIQAGAFSETVSPIITLLPGTEPTGNGLSGGEMGSGGDLDDYIGDSSGDMTVDFGFVEPGYMGLGNLVFNDLNGNRRYDNGEGVDGVVVELYYWGQTPGVDQPLASRVTAEGGKYLFDDLWQGQYFVHLPARQFLASGILRGLFSLEGVQGGDDDQGEDSLDDSNPTTEGISTGRVILTRDSMPTAETNETGFASTDDDGAQDANTDLTVDFGLFRPVAVGNLVFFDENSNGRFDSGEGMDGVSLELYSSGQQPGTDTPVATTVTANGGFYLFDFIRPGNYFVHVPKSMFATGAPLYQRSSINEGLTGDDDVGEDGLNEGIPSVDGVSSSILSLFPGSAPTDSTGETGQNANSDNENDAAVDLTVDFGFQSPVGLGNLIFIDRNKNDVADADEGIDEVRVELYLEGQVPGATAPAYSTTTYDGGRYFFDYLSSGRYIVHIPASEFGIGRPLYQTVSIPGSQTGPGDDDEGEDGLDDANPAVNGISSRVITLAVDEAPRDEDTETGLYREMDDLDDDNFDLTIDFGFVTSNANAMGVGNVVFLDGNASGTYDEGEGVDEVTVQLFLEGDDPQSDTPVATTLTEDEGIYFFGNLTPGNYLVHIPASEFAEGKPLFGWKSIPGQGGDNGLDDGLDENGSDLDPLLHGTTSTVINLTPGAEPVNATTEVGRNAFMDDSMDENVDLTVDFGFSKLAAVGNLVFIDSNANGRADPGEGVANVTVELYAEGQYSDFDLPIASASTDADGFYLITDVVPGRYYLHVPYYHFLPGNPLYRKMSMMGASVGDDDTGEDGLDDSTPASNGISTDVFALSATMSPSGLAEGGLGGEVDNENAGTDAAADLTRDFGFVPQLDVGNLVFRDDDNNGIFNPDTELGIDGVTVELWSNEPTATEPLMSTLTSEGGLYNFSLPAGSYHIRVNANQFTEGGPLEGHRPSSVATPNTGVSFVDDDVGQDAYTEGAVETVGARTASFILEADQAPGDDNGETGFLFFDDESYEFDTDLTVDLGFVPGSSERSAAMATRSEPDMAMRIGASSATAAGTWKTASEDIGPPEGDLDADGAANLLEYALGTDPVSGIQSRHFFLQTDQATGRVDAVVIRPSGGRADIIQQLEIRADLRSGDWSSLTLRPVISQNNDGMETLRFSDVGTLGELGFLRLKVSLDADLNGVPEATVVSTAQAWLRRDFTAQQTFSMPLLAPDVFCGTRLQGVKSLLKPGQSYYVEILDGEHAGRRFELDEEATTNAAPAFETTTPDLAGARMAVRPHWTVDSLFPADTLQPGADETTADCLLFFDPATGSFAPQWLSADGWKGDGDAGRIIAPGEGLLVHVRSGSVPVTFTGAVRSTPYVRPVVAGMQLIGSGFPVAHTAHSLGLTPEAGFTTASTPAQSTRIRLWKGDATPGDNTYRSLYLNQPDSLWLDEADGTDISTQPLFEASRAWFLLTPAAVPEYREP